MKIFVTGGTGLIGKRLVAAFANDEHHVVVATRGTDAPTHPRVRSVRWNGKNDGDWMSEVDRADAVVHLAGEGILDHRWTPEVKARLVDSRVDSTRAVVRAIERASTKPKVLVSGSAVGFYGDTGDNFVDEDAAPANDFLADLCARWESAAEAAKSSGVRVVLARTGVVLAKEGGALAKMLPPFRAFVGGPIGTGKQWFPWIHIDDEVGALRFAVDTDRVVGPMNLVAPNEVRMSEFSDALGRALHRPALVHVPSAAVRLAIGEGAAAVLTGQRLTPKKLLDAGYRFAFPKLDAALADLR